jgi:hypothetical protein
MPLVQLHGAQTYEALRAYPRLYILVMLLPIINVLYNYIKYLPTCVCVCSAPCGWFV